MWNEDHEKVLRLFVQDNDDNNRLLLFFLDQQKNLIVSRTVPPYFVSQLFCLIRKKEQKILAADFSKCVQFQLIRANYCENLLRVMSGVYGPMFFHNKSWPESILSSYFLCV